jgi:peptidyl-prolyl cis-trans isomerase C
MAIVVNGERIEEAQVHEEIERLRPSYEKAFADKAPQERESELLEWSEENLIERVLFQQELKKDEVPVSPDIVDAVLAKMYKEYDSPEEMQNIFGTDEQGIRSLIERHTRERIKIHGIRQSAPIPTSKEIQAYYEANKGPFIVPEQVRVMHIVKRIDSQTDEGAALETMSRAAAEIAGGTAFETVARRYEDLVGDIEDLGYVCPGQMVGEFDDIIFHLGPGQTSPVFRTRFGFHIAKVYDRKPPRVAELKEVRQQIGKELHERSKEDTFAAYLDELRSKATIERI